jgi:hypothetical protein
MKDTYDEFDTKEMQIRVNKISEYLNYNFDQCLNYNLYCKSHPLPQDGDMEQYRRAFYIKKVDPEIEPYFTF